MPQSLFEQTGKLAFLATAAALIVWSFYVPRSFKSHVKSKSLGNEHCGNKSNENDGGSNYAGIFFI